MKHLNKRLKELYETNVIVAHYTSLADEGYNIDLLKTASIDNYRINTDILPINKDSIDISTMMERVKSLLSNIFSAILPNHVQDLAEKAAENFIVSIHNSSNSDSTVQNLGSNKINKRASMAIVKAIKNKQNSLNLVDYSTITTHYQLNLLLNKLFSKNVLFTYIGKYEENKLTGAAEQLIKFIKLYDNDAKYIVERMHKYAETIMELVLFEGKLKTSSEEDEMIAKEFKEDLSRNKKLFEHIKNRQSSNYSITSNNIYLRPAFIGICKFQRKYRKMLKELFTEYKESKGREYSTDFDYYEHLFYTNITDSIAVGIYLPSLFKVIPAFVDAIVSYNVVDCDMARLQILDSIIKKSGAGSGKRQEEKETKEFSVLTGSHDTFGSSSALRTLSSRKEDDFDNPSTQPMKSRDLVFRFAVVLGATNRDIKPSCQGGGQQPPVGPGGGQHPPVGPGGGGQKRPGEQEENLDESLEKDIDMVSKIISQIGSKSNSEEDTEKIKDIIGSILKKVGADSSTDIDETYTDLMKELIKGMGETKERGDNPDTDILDDLSNIAQRIKDKLKDIINRKRKDNEAKEEDENKKIISRNRGKDRVWDDNIDYVDRFDPNIILDTIMDEYKELIEKEIGKGGKGGWPEGLLVRAAFELSGLSGGAIDLVFRLLSRHIHKSVFEDREDIDKSDIKNIEIDMNKLVSIFEKPPLLPVRTEATGGAILPSIRKRKRVLQSVPGIVADYLSIDVSGSMHAIIAEAIKVHQAAQSALQSSGKLSDNPALSRVNEFIIRYLARKIYEHGANYEQNGQKDKNMREALDRVVQFINEFINISRDEGNISDVANRTSSLMDELVKNVHEAFKYFINDMNKEVVDSSDAGTITMAKLLNHLSSVIYMGIYANPIDFLSAKKHGMGDKKKYISIIHDGEVPRYDDESYTYTITSTDNYSSGATTNNTVIFPSLTDSIDIYVSKYDNNENMVKLLDFISRIRLHARNLHGGNDTAFKVGEFWARTFIKDIILSAAGNYSRGVKNTSMRLAFNVLHLTDTNYLSGGGHVAGFVNYILSETYTKDSSGTPPYKRIIDGLLQSGSVHEVISTTSDTIDPKIAQVLREIRDKIYMHTVVFENGGVAIMVNIIDSENKTDQMPTYIYFIDFTDLVVYQFEEATFGSNYQALFKDDTNNVLSKVDFYNKFVEIVNKHGLHKIGNSSNPEKSFDDLKLKRLFVQSVISILPRSVKYYNINTASIALIYMFYSIMVLAFIGSQLRTLVRIGSSDGQTRRIEPDYGEIDRIKLALHQVRRDLERYFLGHSAFSAIFDNIISSYTKMRHGKVRIGDMFERNLDVYDSLSDIGDAVEAWCNANPNISIEEIAGMLDGKVISEDANTKKVAKGHGLYNYTDANANDNPMGGIIPLIPTI